MFSGYSEYELERSFNLWIENNRNIKIIKTQLSTHEHKEKEKLTSVTTITIAVYYKFIGRPRRRKLKLLGFKKRK